MVERLTTMDASFLYLDAPDAPLHVGGVLVLEAYAPKQLGRGTGGPSDPDMLVSMEGLRRELAGLEFVHARELEREVREGAYHTGVAAVVQLVGVRGEI